MLKNCINIQSLLTRTPADNQVLAGLQQLCRTRVELHRFILLPVIVGIGGRKGNPTYAKTYAAMASVDRFGQVRLRRILRQNWKNLH